MYEGNVQEGLKATLPVMAIVALACQRISPESLDCEIHTFFFDFVNERPSELMVIDLAALPHEHAEVFFDGFMNASHTCRFTFGCHLLDRLECYARKIIWVNQAPLTQFSQRLLTFIPAEDVPFDLRDEKFGSDLGL